jgi:hypothetical protein
MREESSEAATAAGQSKQASGEELLRRLAASRAERAILREQVHEALRRLERLSRSVGR